MCLARALSVLAVLSACGPSATRRAAAPRTSSGGTTGTAADAESRPEAAAIPAALDAASLETARAPAEDAAIALPDASAPGADRAPAPAPDAGTPANEAGVDRPTNRDTAAPDRPPDLPPDLAADLPPDAPPQPPTPQPPPNGLIGYWRLDDGAGMRAADSSGNGNDGTLRGYVTADWRAGKHGGALAFDGAGQWIRVPRSTGLDAVTTALTMAAWVQRTASPVGWSNVMSRQWQSSGSEQYLLGFNDGLPTLIVASNQNGTFSCAAASAPALGTWAHVAGTWDGSTGRLYVDGQEVCNFARAVTLVPDVTPLVLGGNANIADDAAQELFAGLLDEMVMYQRALTPAEVAALAR